MSTPKDPQRGKVEECALVYAVGDKWSIIGGQKLGWPSNHRVQFAFASPPNKRPFVTIKLWFPRAYDPTSPILSFDYNGQVSTTLAVNIMLYAGTWVSAGKAAPEDMLASLPPRQSSKPPGLIRFQLKDGHKASVRGLGLPFVARDARDDDIINKGKAIEGVKTLLEICAQREFVLMLGGSSMEPRAREQFKSVFPGPFRPAAFSNSGGQWSMQRYRTEIPRYAGDAPHLVSYDFDTHHDYSVAVTQGVVQDCFHLVEDVRDIRGREVTCMFIRATEARDENAARFFVLVWHGITDDDKCARSLPELLDGRSPLSLAFGPPPTNADSFEDGTPRDVMFWEGLPISRDRWKATGCDLAMVIRRPEPRGLNGLARNMPIMACPSAEGGRKVGGPGTRKYYLKFNSGEHVAYSREIEGSDDDKETRPAPLASMNTSAARPSQGGCSRVEGLPINPRAKVGQAPVLPFFDLLGPLDPRVRVALGKRVGEDARARYKEYLNTVRLAILAIFGFAGSGKTELLAVTGLLFMYHPKIRKIFCSSSTNVATTNLAIYLHRLAKEIAAELRHHGHLVIRGYPLDIDATAFIRIVTSRSRRGDVDMADPFKTAQWELALSPCEWLLKVVGFGDFDLARTDSAFAFELRRRFRTEDKYKGLRDFVDGRIPFEGVVDHTPDKVWRGPARELVKELLKDLVMGADAVCTTPFGSTKGVYARFNATVAQGVILDEAGAMLQADAVTVWGRKCRPCAMAGDTEQLTPAVMMHGKKRDGKVANMFSNLSKVSQLEQVRRSGWPCFFLTVQYRIVHGGFDLPRKIIYSAIPGFKYAAKADVARNPKFQEIENWVTAKYGAPRSPLNTILPLFFDCAESVSAVDAESGTFSRHNPIQNSIAIELVESILSGPLGLTSKDVVVITPYRANCDRLQQAFRTSTRESCRGVMVSTADSFQGREGMVVVFVLCVTQESKPLFVADSHRICVGTTRHAGALYVVGDINTIRPNPSTTELRETEANMTDTAESVTTKDRVLHGFLQYFRDKNRVVQLSASGQLDRVDLGKVAARVRWVEAAKVVVVAEAEAEAEAEGAETGCGGEGE